MSYLFPNSNNKADRSLTPGFNSCKIPTWHYTRLSASAFVRPFSPVLGRNCTASACTASAANMAAPPSRMPSNRGKCAGERLSGQRTLLRQIPRRGGRTRPPLQCGPTDSFAIMQRFDAPARRHPPGQSVPGPSFSTAAPAHAAGIAGAKCRAAVAARCGAPPSDRAAGGVRVRSAALAAFLGHIQPDVRPR